MASMFMAFLIPLTVLSGCAAASQDDASVRVFYLNAENNALVPQKKTLRAESVYGQTQELLDYLADVPADEFLHPPISGFEKRDFSIEEAKRVLEKFDEKNPNLKLTEIDTNLYYAQVGNHEEYRSILYKNGEDMICFYIFDKKHDSYYMYHNEDGWDKMEYGTFPPKITMAIKHSDICSIVYKHDVCDILKKIGNKKLTEIYYALFTDFDKMRKKAKGYVKRILYKKYDKLRKPLYENEYMTIKVRNPIGDCPGILYRRMGTYNDTSEVKIKSKEKDVLMLQKAHEVMAGITNEFQEDLKKRNVLEFEHGYVYLNGDNKKRFFIKTEKCGVVKTDENLPNRVSLRNESELVINTKKLLKEYEKKKNIMIRLLGKKEKEIFK